MKAAAMQYAAVALGTVIGGTARWLASLAAAAWLGAAFPWGTLLVNTTGSFLIGLLAAIAAAQWWPLKSAAARQFLLTGVLGGYTTFSIFSVETLTLAQTGHSDLAAANVAISVLLWLGAVWCGFTLGRRIAGEHAS
jgi:fluoride exporter